MACPDAVFQDTLAHSATAVSYGRKMFMKSAPGRRCCETFFRRFRH
jgi:hypothetical protein